MAHPRSLKVLIVVAKQLWSIALHFQGPRTSATQVRADNLAFPGIVRLPLGFHNV